MACGDCISSAFAQLFLYTPKRLLYAIACGAIVIRMVHPDEWQSGKFYRPKGFWPAICGG
jgi:hypothetical protein